MTSRINHREDRSGASDDFFTPMYSLVPASVPEPKELPAEHAWKIWDVWVRVSDWKLTARRHNEPKVKH
jgi:hypothetical protein